MLSLEPAGQMLIAALTLADRNQREPTTAQPLAEVQDFSPFYFGMYFACADWSGADMALQAAGLANVQDDQLSLTPAGVARASALRDAHPRSVYAYNEFFYRARRSPAHVSFCERVYGLDLCQHGMADMAQTHDLVERLKAAQVRSILELGCGNGALAAYLADQTGAQVTGVDIAEEGIRWARQFAASHPGRLVFHTADMTTVDFSPAIFDALILVDSVYFVHDLPASLPRWLRWLRPNGKLYVFYSAWIDAAGRPDELLVGGTSFARALDKLGIPFDFIDYSACEAAHWQRKQQAAEELKSDFEAEGNAWLQHRRWIETECHRPYVENGNVSRYLYIVSGLLSGRP